MVLLLQTFNKLCSKLDNHHHHHHHRRHGSQASSAASHLQAFESDVSSCLIQFSASSSDSRLLSFPWLLQLLQTLPIVHQAFTKLAVNLEHPVGQWPPDLVDGYLNYTLNLLDLLNSVSFSLSQLGQSRLLLSHALGLIQSSPSMAVERMKPIVPKKNFREFEIKAAVRDRRKGCSGEDWAIERALVTMEGIGYWVCGIVLSGCEGDSTAYLAARKSAAGVAISSFKSLDSVVLEAVSGKGSVPEEVEELNEAAALVAADLVNGRSGSGGAAEEMRRRSERLEKEVERLRKEVDGRFSEVLDGRSRLLDVFREGKH
ncbi:UPF0496 protein 4-like [Momordica charantia]|uniref:UPF0496 protein 4-like n=1 Tax=Momordica charantia TaxID=3673 RepID=A0A6J1DLC1_MOMCH|nr:UPF0496 protein 4-like [Momordica charantia]